MADSPSLSTLLVDPGAVAAAAEPVHAISVAVLHSANALPSDYGVLAVGDQQCADKLRATCRLIFEGMKASSDGLDKLSRALDVAATTYRLTDSDAMVGGAG